MKVVIAPNECLRVKTKPVKKVTPQLLKTFEEMIKLTKTFVEPEGVGLASTQVGLDEQYFISKNLNGSFTVFLNPQIISFGPKTKVFFEGCLSIPNYWGEVVRPTTLKVSYTNRDGARVTASLKGLDAHIFQHEYDHLQGKLFMDMVLEQKGRLFKVVGRDRAGSEVFEEVKI